MPSKKPPPNCSPGECSEHPSCSPDPSAPHSLLPEAPPGGGACCGCPASPRPGRRPHTPCFLLGFSQGFLPSLNSRFLPLNETLDTAFRVPVCHGHGPSFSHTGNRVPRLLCTLALTLRGARWPPSVGLTGEESTAPVARGSARSRAGRPAELGGVPSPVGTAGPMASDTRRERNAPSGQKPPEC